MGLGTEGSRQAAPHTGTPGVVALGSNIQVAVVAGIVGSLVAVVVGIVGSLVAGIGSLVAVGPGFVGIRAAQFERSSGWCLWGSRPFRTPCFERK